MIYDLLKAPEAFQDHLRRYTYSLTNQLVFGFRAPEADDPELLRLYKGFTQWSDLMAGEPLTFLLDVYPIFRRLPDFMLPIRSYAKSLHNSQLNLFRRHWDAITDRVRHGTA
jgi:hypothetical protein